MAYSTASSVNTFSSDLNLKLKIEISVPHAFTKLIHALSMKLRTDSALD